jgi:hypothetical protein
VPLSGGGEFVCTFHERGVAFSLVGASSHARLGLTFKWMANRSALTGVSADRLNDRFRNFDHEVRVLNGVASKTVDGLNIIAGERGALRMLMAQTSSSGSASFGLFGFR